MAERENTLLEGRLRWVEEVLGRPARLPEPSSTPLPPRDRAHLLEEGQELYWNELEWEKITGEERLDEGFLTEMAFPGFLAFVRGLLLEEAMPDSRAPASPRPEVVVDLLRFLAGRVVDLEERAGSGEGEEAVQRRAELRLTERLLDLVLFRALGLGRAEVARLEAALPGR